MTLKQGNLFTEVPDVIPNGIRRTPITGEALRDKGIEKALKSANKKTDKWSEDCYLLLLKFIQIHKRFTCEQFREWVQYKISDPPHNRSFGGIINRAKNSGQIISLGIKPVKNPKAHCALANHWQTVN